MTKQEGETHTGAQKVHILIIENDESIAKMVCDSFESDVDRFQLKVVNNLKESRLAIDELQMDLIIADYLLPDGWGIEFLSSKEEKNRIPLIVLVDQGDEQMGLKAIKSGAMDYVIKSETDISDMVRIVERAIRFWNTHQEFRLEERKLRGVLKEKELILKEIHHRIKNNFQVVCSVLSLQSQYIKDEHVLDMFMETQDRVRAMALIHEKLYQSEDVGRMDFTEYIENLVHGLFWTYGIDPKKVKMVIDVEEIALGIELTVPCGLIINELVSNSLKYAFPPSWKDVGKIEIRLFQNKDGDIELIVQDDGVGIPKDLDIRQTDSFGLELVTILAEDQLNGKVTMDRSRGTKFQIKFKKLKK